MSGYKAKYKDCRTMYVKEDCQLENIMKVISVCGEIGFGSIRLFGESGEKVKQAKYDKIRKQMLEKCEYKTCDGRALLKDEAFFLRGKGQEKTIRVTSEGQKLFEAFEWGKEYTEKYTSRSLPTDRERVLRNVALSEWCIFMMRSGIEFNPKLNPPIDLLSQKASGPQNKNEWTPHNIENPIFYPSKEIKKKTPNNVFRGRGSRAHGFLVKKDRVEVCYRLPKTRMVWQESEEGRMCTFGTTVFGPQLFGIPHSFRSPDALCLVDDYDKCEQVVFESSFNLRKESKDYIEKNKNKTIFKDMFSNVFVFPRNEGGVKSFIFHNIPNIEDLLFRFYVTEESYRKDTYRSGYDCDAFDYDEGVVTLFFFDGNITKLHNCARVRRIHTSGGIPSDVTIRVFCFSWQEEYVKKTFEDTTGVEIIVQNYDSVVDVMKKLSEGKELI